MKTKFFTLFAAFTLLFGAKAAAVEPEPETTYYWYVGTSEPTELNGAVANAETDKWVEIGNDLSAVKYITIDTSDNPDYSFPAWYVLMPTSLGFKPHNSIGTKDESSAWDISDSSIEGYTLYVVDEGTLEAVFSTFKKEGSLPYDENADYWYLGQTDPSTRTEIYPIALQNWAIDDAWEEIVNFSENIEVNKQPADWDFDSFTALWYVAMPASSGYTPQDADLWETSTATIAGKDYIVYKSEGKVWELNTAFLPEGYVEENPEPEPEPEPTPNPVPVNFTFTRGTDVVVDVEGIEVATASIVCNKDWNVGGAMASRTDVLCPNLNTNATSESNVITYTLTINGLAAKQEVVGAKFTHIAVNSAGNLQPSNNIDIRHCNFTLYANDAEVASLTDQNIWIPAGATNKTIAFEGVTFTTNDEGSLVIVLELYKGTSNNGCFYGLTGIELEVIPAEGEGEGTETGIENAEFNIQDSAVIHDLMGRRVEKAEKGIYIVNGKKVVIK